MIKLKKLDIENIMNVGIISIQHSILAELKKDVWHLGGSGWGQTPSPHVSQSLVGNPHSLHCWDLDRKANSFNLHYGISDF